MVYEGWNDDEGTLAHSPGSWDCSTGQMTRYVTAVTAALNALENANTDNEKWMAILADFMRDLILGMLTVRRIAICTSSAAHMKLQVFMR